MDIIENEFHLGALSPFELIHVTDLHLTCCSETDSENMHEYTAKRRERYPFSSDILSKALEISAEDKAKLIITGDIVDCVNDGNTEYIKEISLFDKCIFVAGNHDFRPYGGMQYDVDKSRNLNLPRIGALFGNDIRFSSTVINGINLVGIDNCYYRFEEWQAKKLAAEVDKGLPIILLMHVPLYTEACYSLIITEKKRNYASLVGVPGEKMKTYPPERYVQQMPDSITLKMCEYISSESLIKLVLCGHVHKNIEDALVSGIPQIITGTNTIRKITIS